MREKAHGVTCCALLLEGVPLKINTMDVHFCTQPKGVPTNFVPGTHLQPVKVPIHASVYSYIKREDYNRKMQSKILKKYN